MKSELQQLRDGDIGFDGFVRATRPEWERLAARLYNAYPAIPDGVEVVDLMQEMLLTAWQRALDWDPKFGSSLTTYVTWSAYAAAKRWLNEQRNSLRRSDKTPGRYPVSESKFLGRGTSDPITDWGLADMMSTTTPEEQYGARMVFTRVLCSIEDPQMMTVLELWAEEGGTDAAIERMTACPELASALNVWDPRAARRLVSQAITTAATAVSDLDESEEPNGRENGFGSVGEGRYQGRGRVSSKVRTVD